MDNLKLMTLAGRYAERGDCIVAPKAKKFECCASANPVFDHVGGTCLTCFGICHQHSCEQIPEKLLTL